MPGGGWLVLGLREGSCLGMGNFSLVFGGSRGDALTTETWVTALTGLVGLVAAVAAWREVRA